MKGDLTEVVVYQGETVIAIGTVRQCAKELGVKPSTIYYYLMPAYQRKIARRRNSRGNLRRVVATSVDEG